MPPPKKTRTGRVDVEVAAGIPLPPTTLHNNTHMHTRTTPLLVWQGEMRPVALTANPSGARPVPLDPLDRILVGAVVAGWSHCVILAWSLTQYRYVPCGPDYQGTV